VIEADAHGAQAQEACAPTSRARTREAAQARGEAAQPPPSRADRPGPDRRRAAQRRSYHNAGLIGLGLAAVGLFLATLVYLGWEGGRVGAAMTDGLWALLGDASYLLPPALVVVGTLMLGRSAIVELRPFRTGLAVTALGLMLVLAGHGGYVGRALEEGGGTRTGEPAQ